jgi:hypothetical protein
MVFPLFLSVLMAAGPQAEYVAGLGWVNSKIVSHCLVAVGVPETDYLTDRSWEEFQDCVNARRGRRR